MGTGQPAVAPSEGALFYVVGPAAAGKHRLLAEARSELAADHRVVFAHRYVTRTVAADGENDEIELPEAEFAARVRHRLFTMHWEHGGARYGIGMEINYWLALGLSVVVKGSHSYLPQALEVYPEMTVLWIGPGHGDVRARNGRTGRGASVIYMACDGRPGGTRTQLISVLSASPVRS